VLGFFKKRREEKQMRAAAYELGQEAGRALSEAAQSFLTARVYPVAKNYSALFRKRLTMIYDEPGYAPEEVAKAEWTVYLEQIKEFEVRLKQEAQVALSEWLVSGDIVN